MKIVKPLLLSLSLLAFAAASAYAADATKSKDAQAKPSVSQSNKAAGSASGGSTAGATRLDFDKADKNHDGQLSRAEFEAMLKGDSAASSGSTTKPATDPTSKPGKMGEKPASTK
jgi:hypothetical protein